MESRARAGLLDRMLRLFTDVRAGESGTALLLALDVFLILTAYYFIKPIREALILEGGGAEVKSYAAAGQALILLGAVPAYGVLAARLPRRRLINVVTFFFVACLGVFYGLGQLQVAPLPLAIVFFLWVGIFNLMIVAQFWSFANDVYTSDEGERLFPIVGFGASSGAVAGALIAGRLIAPLGIYALMLLAAGLLVLSVLITNVVDRRERARTEAARAGADTTAEMPAASQDVRLDTGEFRKLSPEALERLRDERASKEEVLATLEREDEPGEGPFRLVFRYRYLLLIALLMLFLNWVNTTGEYILARVVEDAAREAVELGRTSLSVAEYIGRFYSDFFSVVNVLGLVLQLFVVSRVIKYLGVQLALMILPIIALGAYTLLAFYPVLAFVRWSKTAENATDYSLQNTVRNVLFLPTTREQKYKAKQVVDSFFVRAGDVLSAVVVFVGTTYLAMEAQHFAVFNLALVAVWLAVAVLIGRRYRRLVARGEPPRRSGVPAPAGA